MGLDTSHDCFHGPYSAFGRFRDCIALAAGFEFEPYNFIPGVVRERPALPWDSYTDDNFQGIWETAPDDILIVFLAHEDCQGHIDTKHCAALADRLEGLIPKLQTMDLSRFASPYDQIAKRTEQFVAGLRDAAKAGEHVEFG